MLLLVPFLAADGVVSARGQFMSAFWASPRDSKRSEPKPDLGARNPVEECKNCDLRIERQTG